MIMKYRPFHILIEMKTSSSTDNNRWFKIPLSRFKFVDSLLAAVSRLKRYTHLKKSLENRSQGRLACIAESKTCFISRFAQVLKEKRTTQPAILFVAKQLFKFITSHIDFCFFAQLTQVNVQCRTVRKSCFPPSEVLSKRLQANFYPSLHETKYSCMIGHSPVFSQLARNLALIR